MAHTMQALKAVIPSKEYLQACLCLWKLMCVVCVSFIFCCFEDAKKFKDAFEECQEKLASTGGEEEAELAAKMDKLEVEREESEREVDKVWSWSTV